MSFFFRSRGGDKIQQLHQLPSVSQRETNEHIAGEQGGSGQLALGVHCNPLLEAGNTKLLLLSLAVRGGLS